MTETLIQAIGQALQQDPKNGTLWLHYGELLQENKQQQQALEAFRNASELVEDKKVVYKKMIPLLRQMGKVAEALIRAEDILAENEDDLELQRELLEIFKAREDWESAAQQYQKIKKQHPEVKNLEEPTATSAPQQQQTTPKEPALANIAPEPLEEEDLESMFDWGDLHITFKDVAGLQQVKKQINLRIIAPFKNPEIYKAFQRTAGGGILLYGPPGCGKTFIARATAGECGANFVAVSIHDIVDKYWGESEKLVHTLFQEAKRKAPTILFFDEFDALGAARGKSESQFWKTLVNQMLQEMDGLAGKNNDLMIFAATNMPWNIDPAFRRPGRFDRILFVPPPDEKAAADILQRHIEKLPGAEKIKVAKIAKKAHLMTGADLKALCERAAENALAQSLESGEIHPVTLADFDQELKNTQSSALEWFTSARNYARYANEGGQYDELTKFLKQNKLW